MNKQYVNVYVKLPSVDQCYHQYADCIYTRVLTHAFMHTNMHAHMKVQKYNSTVCAHIHMQIAIASFKSVWPLRLSAWWWMYWCSANVCLCGGFNSYITSVDVVVKLKSTIVVRFQSISTVVIGLVAWSPLLLLSLCLSPILPQLKT